MSSDSVWPLAPLYTAHRVHSGHAIDTARHPILRRITAAPTAAADAIPIPARASLQPSTHSGTCHAQMASSRATVDCSVRCRLRHTFAAGPDGGTSALGTGLTALVRITALDSDGLPVAMPTEALPLTPAWAAFDAPTPLGVDVCTRAQHRVCVRARAHVRVRARSCGMCGSQAGSLCRCARSSVPSCVRCVMCSGLL